MKVESWKLNAVRPSLGLVKDMFYLKVKGIRHHVRNASLILPLSLTTNQSMCMGLQCQPSHQPSNKSSIMCRPISREWMPWRRYHDTMRLYSTALTHTPWYDRMQCKYLYIKIDIVLFIILKTPSGMRKCNCLALIT